MFLDNNFSAVFTAFICSRTITLSLGNSRPKFLVRIFLSVHMWCAFCPCFLIYNKSAINHTILCISATQGLMAL